MASFNSNQLGHTLVSAFSAFLQAMFSERELPRLMSVEEHRAVAIEELRELGQAIIGPLKSGLHSFNKVSEMLLSVNADIIYPGCQTYRHIRREIENMKYQMEESEQVAKKELLRLDRDTERLTADQSKLANQKHLKEGELKDLKTQLDSHKSSLESYNEALRTERRNLESAEDTLRRLRRRRDDAEEIRNAGIVVSLIPVVGWVAGPVMIIGGQLDMNEASEAASSARREVENCESQVERYSDKVSEYESLIRQAKRNIRDTDSQIRVTENKLRGLSVKRQVVADVQIKTRRAVRQLGQLCGVGNVAELQTRRLILLEPVMKVMEEMTTALGQITGDDMLNTEGIKSLMWDMKMNQSKLKQLADTKDADSDNDYY